MHAVASWRHYQVLFYQVPAGIGETVGTGASAYHGKLGDDIYH
jgi:hypothetical protein